MSTNDWRSAGHEFEIFLDLSVVQAVGNLRERLVE
jgi:hypothetical protein